MACEGAAFGAKKFQNQLSSYDALFVTSLIGLADLKSYWGSDCPPVFIYMHECQLNYPLPKGEILDVHFVMNDFSNLFTQIRFCLTLKLTRIVVLTNYRNI